MDLHCKQEAENFVAEILDSTTHGNGWKSSSRTGKKKLTLEKPGNGSSAKLEPLV